MLGPYDPDTGEDLSSAPPYDPTPTSIDGDSSSDDDNVGDDDR